MVPDWQYGPETQAGLVPASLPAGPAIRSLILEVIFKDSLSNSSVTIPANTGCPDALPLTLWPALCFPFPGAEPDGYATVPGLFANLPISKGERLFLSFQAVGVNMQPKTGKVAEGRHDSFSPFPQSKPAVWSVAEPVICCRACRDLLGAVLRAKGRKDKWLRGDGL